MITSEHHEENYNSIIRFYDLAEELIDTVESKEIEDPSTQLDFIEPLVEQIEEATDVLAEEYFSGSFPTILFVIFFGIWCVIFFGSFSIVARSYVEIMTSLRQKTMRKKREKEKRKKRESDIEDS